MSFDVYNENRTALRNDPSDPDNKTIFPLRATSPGNMVISTINPNQMWFAAAVRNGNATALYYTEDKGQDFYYTLRAFSGSLYNIYVTWILEDSKESAEEIVSIICKIYS